MKNIKTVDKNIENVETSELQASYILKICIIFYSQITFILIQQTHKVFMYISQ